MKAPYLVFALFSSLVLAQSAAENDCQCPQIKCRATNEFESCRCANAAELACKKKCPDYISTRWRKCTLTQQDITSSAPATSTTKAALPLPTEPILLLPDPILPKPLPSPLVLPFPDLPLVPGCTCEETMCIMSFPEGCHCQWNVKKDCYNKCGGVSPGINTCPALPKPIPPPVVLPKPPPSPLVLPFPDLPLVPGCTCEETMCIMSFPEGCHCQWNVKKDCYNKCGGVSPGINTCPTLPVPPVPKPTPRPKPTPSVLPDLPKVPGCECEEMMCIQSFPESCHCEYGIARNCYDKCGGKSPGLNTCPPKDVFGAELYGDGPVKREAVPDPQRSTVPIPATVPKPVTGVVGAAGNKPCKYEERFCAQVWPQSCICANANKYARYLKCGGVAPTYQVCSSPPKPYLPTTIKTITRTTGTTQRPSPTPKPALHKVQICGGGRGSQLQACPSGFTCVNDPYVDQPCGLECDRTGICVEEKLCGGFAGFKCSQPGQVCLDDPRDDCSPATGGADCGGMCFWPPALRAKA